MKIYLKDINSYNKLSTDGIPGYPNIRVYKEMPDRFPCVGIPIFIYPNFGLSYYEMREYVYLTDFKTKTKKKAK